MNTDAVEIEAARSFWLVRDVDISGVSGLGTVADGAEFPDGVCVLRWRGGVSSTAMYLTLDDLIAIHGHNGATRVVWVRQ